MTPANFRRRAWHPATIWVVWATLLGAWVVGMFDRGYWTPDEPREADIAWRMSWQPLKAVPLLAGEPFCEKPPLTYWVAGAVMGTLGAAAWAARLPNLVYALVTALAVGALARRSAGSLAGAVAAAAIGTFLLTYQVAIWLATDAPLLAAVAAALLGLHIGFYAGTRGERLRGYSFMHAALAMSFLCKSAAGWMVPVLTFLTLVIWERRWRELLRWELYVGLVLQAVPILTWVWAVYAGPDGTANLKVFFWNNLVGRFAHVDAPEELQYTAGHLNSPGKYFLELPGYLWPWTLLVLAAARRVWASPPALSRFAIATFVPTLAVLSLAATARNIYLAPALPGVALLLGAWASNLAVVHDTWDARALRATAVLLLIAVLAVAAAMSIVGRDSWDTLGAPITYVVVSGAGLAGAAACALWGWRAAGRGAPLQACLALFLSYGALLVGPASQAYARVDAWQDLAAVGRAIEKDTAGKPMILFAPDETTRAFIDMYARRSVGLIPGPIASPSIGRLRAALAGDPRSVVVTQLAGRTESRTIRELKRRFGLEKAATVPRTTGSPPDAGVGGGVPDWAAALPLRIATEYELPNGRRYALLESVDVSASR